MVVSSIPTRISGFAGSIIAATLTAIVAIEVMRCLTKIPQVTWGEGFRSLGYLGCRATCEGKPQERRYL